MGTLRWRHNGCDSVSNHQPRECLLRRLMRRTSKKTSKLRVTGLCAGNSPGTGEFPAQMASDAENVSIWWRHHVLQNATQSTNRSHSLSGFYHKNLHIICILILNTTRHTILNSTLYDIHIKVNFSFAWYSIFLIIIGVLFILITCDKYEYYWIFYPRPFILFIIKAFWN